MAEDIITLGHGSGGKLSHDLIRDVFLPQFDNSILAKLDDMANLNIDGLRLAYTTDSFVVNPLFFPGGDMGRLAVCGTVNDLSMGGARPLYLSASFIIEEGFPLATLKRIISSMREAATEAEVVITAGDTKVVEKGAADGLFITTSGIGIIEEGVYISGGNAQVGDLVILSGYIADHGLAVLSQREGLEFRTRILSDCAPLNHLVRAMLKVTRDIRCLRDPTRGGLATTLNEFALQSKVGIVIEEGKIPIREEVKGLCEILGLDPLYIANEGKLVAVVAPQVAENLLEAMQRTRYGENAQIIGRVVAEPKGKVYLKTSIGGTRLVDLLVGDQLPRIC